MKKFYIFKVGETFEATKAELGDFDTWVQRCAKETEMVSVDVLRGEALPAIEKVAGVIITGSHAMVTDELPWSLAVEAWVREAAEQNVGILGICYGHQLLAKALGGRSDYNPKGKEIGTVRVISTPKAKSDPLFAHAPESFDANVTHMQSALSLPKGATVLGYNAHDAHQIVRFTTRIWGVQFHPEYDETIMKYYIREQANELEQMGFASEVLIADVKETAYANTLIGRFVGLLSDD